MYPSFIRGKPKEKQEALLRRIQYETKLLGLSFPFFQFMQDNDGEYFVEGKLKTVTNNVYKLKVYYTKEYPFEPPMALIMDRDVIKFCSGVERRHDYHNYGVKKGGIHICVISNSSTPEERGWEKEHSIVSLVTWAAQWLHAYEVKRVTGKWILPE